MQRNAGRREAFDFRPGCFLGRCQMRGRVAHRPGVLRRIRVERVAGRFFSSAPNTATRTVACGFGHVSGPGGQCGWRESAGAIGFPFKLPAVPELPVLRSECSPPGLPLAAVTLFPSSELASRQEHEHERCLRERRNREEILHALERARLALFRAQARTKSISRGECGGLAKRIGHYIRFIETDSKLSQLLPSRIAIDGFPWRM